jgi:hypothetical protein
MNAARRCAAKVGFPPFGLPGIVCHRNGRRTMATDGRIRCADLLRIPRVVVEESPNAFVSFSISPLSLQDAFREISTSLQSKAQTSDRRSPANS